MVFFRKRSLSGNYRISGKEFLELMDKAFFQHRQPILASLYGDKIQQLGELIEPCSLDDVGSFCSKRTQS